MIEDTKTISDIDEALKRAKASHERGALGEAERGYAAVLRTDPEHAEALHLFGVLRFQQGRLEEADGLLLRSTSGAPTALALANRSSVLTALARPDDSLVCLDAALSLDAGHPRALFLRAGALIEKGRYAEALADCDRLLERAPNAPEALCRRGVVLHLVGRSDESLVCLDRALALDRKSFEALRRSGDVLLDTGRVEEALMNYGRALAIMPGHPLVLLRQGVALLQSGNLREALGSFNEALAARPTFVDALFSSSVALERLREYEQALARCERILRIEPRHAGALANRGNALCALGRHAEALQSYDASLGVEPGSREVLSNRASVLEALDRQAEALGSSERALAVDATFVPAWIAKGRALQRLHRYEEALQSFDQAVCLAPDNSHALYQRGNSLRVLMRHEEALASFDRGLAVEPTNVDAHLSKAFVYLTIGDFERGWPEYEWRWREAQVGTYKRSFPQPLWLGAEPVAGKTLLLHAEQGFGDTLQFCRYATLLKNRGARIVLEVQGALTTLLRNVDGVDEIVANGSPLPPFDMHCPLLSLGLVFRTDLASIPTNVPYVSADPVVVRKWSSKLGPKTRRRVGIVWSGNPNHANDHNRSIPFTGLTPMFTDGIEWVSLQKAVNANERMLLAQSAVRDFSRDIRDFADTAALVESMDLIISVDTSVAHLAGAMGRPVWILLPYLSDWRWLLEREDSPWYPSARLFWQSRPGQWSDVIERVAAELTTLAPSFASAVAG